MMFFVINTADRTSVYAHSDRDYITRWLDRNPDVNHRVVCDEVVIPGPDPADYPELVKQQAAAVGWQQVVQPLLNHLEEADLTLSIVCPDGQPLNMSELHMQFMLSQEVDEQQAAREKLLYLSEQRAQRGEPNAAPAQYEMPSGRTLRIEKVSVTLDEATEISPVTALQAWKNMH